MSGIMQSVATTKKLVPATGSVSFSYTGADQTWTVPTGVYSITTTIKGASGGNASSATGGTGASITTTIPVVPGDTLRLVVGAKGNDGVSGGTTNVLCAYGGGGYGGRSGGSTVYSGAAGGGYSGIFKLNTISVANALVVAGAGGGATLFNVTPANGGAAGTSGNASDGVNGDPALGHTGGYAATTSSNGIAGIPYDTQSVNPAAGSQLAGGNGGEVTTPTWSGGGGAGAGYYSGGGGAGGGTAIGGGAGGTSYILNGSNTSYTTNTGNGSIAITY